MKKVIENQLNLFETIFTTVVKHTTKREKQKDLKEETQLSFIQISTSKEKEEIKSEIKEEIKCKIKEDIKNEVIEPTEIIPVQKGEDYRIKEDDLIFNGPKMKYQCNIEAIKTLLKVEAENRPATKEEQSLLVKYVGWGGLSEVFDVTKESWEKEFYELKSLLGEKEYRKARESVLTAFFTPKAIIDFMYKVLEKFNFTKGNVLEPAMGIGHFFGLLPDRMLESSLYGVEIDDISARIAKILYPNTTIYHKGFEEVIFPKNFFDVAISNIPFGEFTVVDPEYKGSKYYIHDYFIFKMVDKVRPGGIVAVITSKGTLDKKNNSFRKELAKKVELLGAVRLPNTAFKKNAGTEATTDILFFKKLSEIPFTEPNWVNTDITEDGILMNQYFIDHPEFILGEMKIVSGPFGSQVVCLPTDIAIETLLEKTLQLMHGSIDEIEMDEETLNSGVIPAIPNTDNFSYVVYDNDVYYRENSIMRKIEGKDNDRIKEMVKIKKCFKELIQIQLMDIENDDEILLNKQEELLNIYETFVKRYGFINSRANQNAFMEDESLLLISSLEELNSKKKVVGKSKIFFERTILPKKKIEFVENVQDALILSLQEYDEIDLDYISQLTQKDLSTVENLLYGSIFLNPITLKYETKEEYLSGNVKAKLIQAKEHLAENNKYEINIRELEAILPPDIDAADIAIRLGVNWINPKYITQFIIELLEVPYYAQEDLSVEYSKTLDAWTIKGYGSLKHSINATSTYGTRRMNAYRIIENLLNSRESKVFDKIDDGDTVKRVLNHEETTLALQKQEEISQSFKDWIFKDYDRREEIARNYNDLFNNTVTREYDGSYLNFVGMSDKIVLKEHQKNAIARILHGKNTLLGHVVGAGKTFEMVAACMEGKRLGLWNKSLFVVPNHLTEQIAKEFLILYPTANILVSRKKDFEKINRKKFFARIITGNYDAIIIGHSQFTKMAISKQREMFYIQEELDAIDMQIEEARSDDNPMFSVKKLMNHKKKVEAKLKKLAEKDSDNIGYFEQLGIDKLFVDEAHEFKNLYVNTKMNNVAGIAQTQSQKAFDLYVKCRYMDELTNGTGVVFATGTPLSNSMTELYTMMRYLQYNRLEELGLTSFDLWAATFGEIESTMELKPEGDGYLLKTRFSKFFNLPELMSIFKECADIKTAEVLDLDVPDAEFINIETEPSEDQKKILEKIVKRADIIRSGMVDSSIDNMLKITTDGRKLALDVRILDPSLSDFKDSKVNICANNIFEIWKETEAKNSTQLVFSDLSTPNQNQFNVYQDLKDKLILKGIPESEIAFIHDATTELLKDKLFEDVRNGIVRILIGSTAKMGAGTNIQDKLIALHHLDVPWRPSDITQREGRIIRFGNTNEKVTIYRYITKGTFDAYSWQILEKKQRFISQVMTNKDIQRQHEDIDEAVLTYSEVKALAVGNPFIKEKMTLEVDISKLKLLKNTYSKNKYRLEKLIKDVYPNKISQLENSIINLEKDIEFTKSNPTSTFKIEILDTIFNNEEDFFKWCNSFRANPINIHTVFKDYETKIGNYRGFDLYSLKDKFSSPQFILRKNGSYPLTFSVVGKTTLERLDQIIDKFELLLESKKVKFNTLNNEFETAQKEMHEPFKFEEELKQKTLRLVEVDGLINENC